ncbi:Ribonuclease H-like domain,Integrase, catalytic core [Cinara cedri]|uniref:Ribonuclease H-like domain,Integrase, catalytic core n=1 Tax=Cinara cedri TaxID=506608 RepID=A0A5E4NNA1_9HEMI|nr:Ribonuclease H-like domain,Integrase, catalytic core [Cinara cedri]
MKSNFYNELHKNRTNLANNTSFLFDEKYNELIEIISELKAGRKKKQPKDFRLIKRYDVLVVQGNMKLIFSVKDDNVVLYYVPTSELFDILQTTHISGHGGHDRMIKELRNKYKNIPRSKKGVVVKPIISSDFNSRCQVDLIDFQSHPDGKFKFIMVYQDHLTKFFVFKPLEFNRAEEVVYNIIDIFTLLGAPTILQSDNGREFSNQIVSNLRNMWPELKIVHGKPRHSQSQGTIERANQDIENMLTTWMQDEKNRHWSQGLRFIQLMKNRAYHSGIKMSPYEALFDCKIKIGLNTSNLPHDSQNIENEASYTDQLFVTTIRATIKLNNENANVMRTRAKENLENQAKNIMACSDKKLLPVAVHSTVHVPVPEIDKGRLDAQSILAIVLEVTSDGFY